MSDELVFSEGIKIIVEVSLVGDPKLGRVVEIHDDRGVLAPMSLINDAAKEFNEPAITVEYYPAMWIDNELPNFGDFVDFDGENATRLGRMEEYKEEQAQTRKEINKLKVKINAFEKKHIIDRGWGH